MKTGSLAVAAIAALITTLLVPPSLRLVWNTTASMPVGLYVVGHAYPRHGDLLVTRLPPEMEALAVSRGLLLPNTPVLKAIAALGGDLACRSGTLITINGSLAASARKFDLQGRSLPTWNGCRRLAAHETFILAQHPDSFDSRYYGPVSLALAVGTARPLLTCPK